jgi:hypothetical protein
MLGEDVGFDSAVCDVEVGFVVSEVTGVLGFVFGVGLEVVCLQESKPSPINANKNCLKMNLMFG